MKSQIKDSLLKCPKCNKEGLQFNKCIYKRWISKIECGKNNQPTKKWILYNKSSRWACCICCFYCCEKAHSCTVEFLKMHDCDGFSIIYCFPCYLLYIILYIIFNFFLDLFTFIFCQKREFFDVCYRDENSSEKIRQKCFIIAKDIDNIFLKVTGFSEEE